jgi:putative oxidoreductase
MNYVKQIPALLLGLLFVAFSVMFFADKMPKQEMSEGAMSFFNVFGPTGYMKFIKGCELLFGILLLLPKTRALGLILMMPICVNIMCYELFIDKHPGIGIGLVIVNIIGLFLNKEKYASIMS